MTIATFIATLPASNESIMHSLKAIHSQVVKMPLLETLACRGKSLGKMGMVRARGIEPLTYSV